MARDTLRTGGGGRTPSAKPLVFLTMVAILLLVAVPISILVALFMIAFGHFASGFALIGVSVLLAVVGIVAAGATGVRHLKRVVEAKSFRVVQLNRTDYSFDCGHDHSQDGPPTII